MDQKSGGFECCCCWFEGIASNDIPASEKVERSPVSGRDGNDSNGIGVMSADFGNIFFFLV